MTITHLELKNFVLDNIGSYLGNYTHPSGVTEPAIALLPHPSYGYYYPPNTWKVNGIEAVILRVVADERSIRQLHGGDVYMGYHWRIALKQHDQNGDLYKATEALIVAIAPLYKIQGDAGYVPASEKMRIIASSIITICDPVTIAAV